MAETWYYHNAKVKLVVAPSEPSNRIMILLLKYFSQLRYRWCITIQRAIDQLGRRDEPPDEHKIESGVGGATE